MQFAIAIFLASKLTDEAFEKIFFAVAQILLMGEQAKAFFVSKEEEGVLLVAFTSWDGGAQMIPSDEAHQA